MTLKTMNKEERHAWAERVFTELQNKLWGNLSRHTFEFHAGKEYRYPLETLLKEAGARFTCPVDGLSFGRRLQYYDKSPIFRSS